MVRAAVRGVVDYRRADPRSSLWWRGLWLRLRELEREDLGRRADREEALLGRLLARRLEADDRARLADRLRAVRQASDTLLRPWDAAAQETRGAAPAASLQRLEAQWKDTWGDPAAPETAAAVERTVAYLRSGRQGGDRP